MLQEELRLVSLPPNDLPMGGEFLTDVSAQPSAVPPGEAQVWPPPRDGWHGLQPAREPHVGVAREEADAPRGALPYGMEEA